MTKNELKLIIKECMLELLNDGLGAGLNEVKQKKQKDQQLVETRRRQDAEVQRKRSMTGVIANVTDDPIMRKILSHTAQTTLKEQMSHEAKSPGMHSQPGIEMLGNDSIGAADGDAGMDISSIFGGATRNWESMAFSEKKRP